MASGDRPAVPREKPRRQKEDGALHSVSEPLRNTYELSFGGAGVGF